MTIIFPDVSEYQTSYNFSPYPVALARATISNVKDRQWDINRSSAALAGKHLAAYAFLNAPSLGVSVNAQADFAYAIVAGTPTMLDVEPNRGACASFADVQTWIARFRSHGGICHLCYLPKWAWSGNMGSPSLVPLTQESVNLVSSNYTTYSDTGPGWVPYGGVTPVQWQFTDNINGTGGDGNAYRGTADEWWNMVSQTKGLTEMEQADVVIGSLSRGNSVGDTLSDGTNWRDEWYLDPKSHSKNPPPPGSRFDLLMQAASKILAATSLGTTVALTDAQVNDLAVAIAQNVVTHHDALSADDLGNIQTITATTIKKIFGTIANA